MGPRGKGGRRAAVHLRARPLPGGGAEELPNTEAGRRKATDLLEEDLRGRDRREARAEADSRDPMFAEVAELDLEHVAATKAPRTATAYRERLQVAQRYAPPGGEMLGFRRVASLTHADGVRMVKAWRAAGRSPNYITNGLLLTVKACLNWAAAADPVREPARLIPANPWADLAGPGPASSSRAPTWRLTSASRGPRRTPGAGTGTGGARGAGGPGRRGRAGAGGPTRRGRRWPGRPCC